MEATNFLAACKATDSRNKSLEEIRDKGAEVILSVFRMFKNSLVHATDNKAVLQTVEETHGILTDFASTVGGYVSVTFVEDTIFVCGQLLRASRSIYEQAMEVGKLLGICGVSEISFQADVTREELVQLCTVFSIAVRDPKRRAELINTGIDNVQVRALDTKLQADEDETDLPDMERTLRAYASALVVMRDFMARIAAGKTVMPHKVKRIAQRLVSLAESDEGALLALTSMAHSHRDDAGRAVQSAILAISIARRLTRHRGALAQLGMAALMADIGRVRIAGSGGLEKYVQLSDDVERAVPSLTSSLCISTGGVNIQNALRTVTAFEASTLERSHLMGALYKRQMAPMVQSKILHVVRELLARTAPRDNSRAMSPLDAMADLPNVKNLDDIAYKLLVSAVGVLPMGTVVEFETGEWGVVVGPSKNRKAIAKPRIKLMTDRSGQVFSKPKVIDLGEPSEGRRFPKITGVIEPSKARFNVARALMAEGLVGAGV